MPFMTPAPSQPAPVGGAAGARTLDPPAPPWKWRQHPAVRMVPAVLVVLALLWVQIGFPPSAGWSLPLTDFASLEVTARAASFYVGLLLIPFLGRVSYRKRDVLLIGLVPVYGQIVVGKVIYRLLSLPWRSWPPRPDELPRVVRVPGARGAYLLRPSFGEAEELRTSWCVNPQHQHPYESWAVAHHVGCAQRNGSARA